MSECKEDVSEEAFGPGEKWFAPDARAIRQNGSANAGPGIKNFLGLASVVWAHR